jgi:hypothetical protein
MKKIYIDFTGGSLSTENLKFHGGGFFSKTITLKLADFLKTKSRTEYGIVVLLPRKIYNYEEFITLFSGYMVEFELIDSLLTFAFPKTSKLLIPLISNHNLIILKKLRIKFPSLSTIVVIHGIRGIDLTKFDNFDRYYYDGIRNTFYLLNYFYRLVISFKEKNSIKKYINYASTVITVSNYTMQFLAKFIKDKKVLLYKQDSLVNNKFNQNNKLSNSILFLSGGRFEKNLIRSLVSFQLFKKHDLTNISLTVTGVSKALEKKIYGVKDLDNTFLKKWVVFLDYVSDNELSKLYSECIFLMYTSKSEGYGLPVLEAANYGKVSICSYLTSIPEVLGSAAIYCNPYSINSIYNAILLLSNSDNRLLYESYVQHYLEAVKIMQRVDSSVLLSELIK